MARINVQPIVPIALGDLIRVRITRRRACDFKSSHTIHTDRGQIHISALCPPRRAIRRVRVLASRFHGRTCRRHMPTGLRGRPLSGVGTENYPLPELLRAKVEICGNCADWAACRGVAQPARVRAASGVFAGKSECTRSPAHTSFWFTAIGCCCGGSAPPAAPQRGRAWPGGRGGFSSSISSRD